MDRYQKALDNINELMCSECHPNKEFCHSKCVFPQNYDTLQELIDNYSKLERALDIASDIIANTNNHFTPQEIDESKESWKEYLLKGSWR